MLKKIFFSVLGSSFHLILINLPHSRKAEEGLNKMFPPQNSRKREICKETFLFYASITEVLLGVID